MRANLILCGALATVLVILGHSIVDLRKTGKPIPSNEIEGPWTHHVTNWTGIIVVEVIAIDINVIVRHGA